jgi:hypothetical protein
MDMLFWFVGSADLSQQLSLACRRYEERTGRKATRVLVPKGSPTAGVTGLTFAEDPLVLQGHMMVGE